MGFLRIENKKFLVFGVANKKSVAFHVARTLEAEGAEPLFSVLNEDAAGCVRKNFPGRDVRLCDVSDETQLKRLSEEIRAAHGVIGGIVHSVAFANYSAGPKPFHETLKKDFLQAVDISCFSLVSIAGHFKDVVDKDGAIVTITISATDIAAESYGYMAPVKAALNSSVRFLAKSLSADANIRVNGVGASLLKTSSSAGIPGYLEPYMFAEKLTLRKRALATEEVADAAVFLLSPRASGINAQIVVVDAGMSTNFFDKAVVSAALKNG